MEQQLKRPGMKLKNVQTNNTFFITDREQIGKCLSQTFQSRVPCERFVEGIKRQEWLIRELPRFEIKDCDPELVDLIPKEEVTISIRERLLGKETTDGKMKTMEELQAFAREKGIPFAPNISFGKLEERVEAWKKNSGRYNN